MLLICVSYGSVNPEGIQTYQKNTNSSAERKQNLANDISRYRNADNIWDVLREEFTLPHYEDSPAVQAQIRLFMNDPDFLIHAATRAGPYLYYILQQTRKRHLPAELVLLPMIESAYNPFAYSSAGAAGIWQMMPNTASGFGIKQDWWYDGRRDVVTSTKAALNYLAYLGNFFEGNWLLATAAYDTGEGSVLSAIHKNIRVGENTDFWSLPLSQETRDYVPRLLALAIIISHPEKYPVDFPPIHNAPYLAQVDVGKQMNLGDAASLAGLSLQKLKQLNPGYNRTITDPTGPYKLVLPIENVEQFTENLEQSTLYRNANWNHDRTKIASRTKTISQTILNSQQHYLTSAQNNHKRYVLQPGDTLYMVRPGDYVNKIAKRFRIEAKTLLAVNHLHSIQSALPIGQKLIIPTHANKSNVGRRYKLAPGDTVYVARNGDTIEKIAKKFHITPASLRLANLLANNTIREGDRLLVPTHSYSS